MHRALADAEFSRGGPDRGPVLQNVKSQTLGPFLHVSFQAQHSPPLTAPSYAGRGRDMWESEWGDRGPAFFGRPLR